MNRLSAVGQSDDAQSTIGQGETGPEEVAVLVGSAVKNRVGHPADARGINRRLPGQSSDSRDATHRRISGAVMPVPGISVDRLSVPDRAEM
jgi:hypothetical protein